MLFTQAGGRLSGPREAGGFPGKWFKSGQLCSGSGWPCAGISERSRVRRGWGAGCSCPGESLYPCVCESGRRSKPTFHLPEHSPSPWPPTGFHLKLCWKYLGPGRIFSSKDFIPCSLGVKEGQAAPKTPGDSIEPPQLIISLRKAHRQGGPVRPQSGPSPGSAETCKAVRPGQGWGQERLSLGSLWLLFLCLQLKRATLGRKHYAHKHTQERGSEAEPPLLASKEHPVFCPGRSRERKRDPAGHAQACYEEPWLAYQPQDIRLRAKRMCFPGKVGGEEKNVSS